MSPRRTTERETPDGPAIDGTSRTLVAAMKRLDLAGLVKARSGWSEEAHNGVELQQQKQQSRPFSLSSPRTPHPGQHLAEQVSRLAAQLGWNKDHKQQQEF